MVLWVDCFSLLVRMAQMKAKITGMRSKCSKYTISGLDQAQ